MRVYAFAEPGWAADAIERARATVDPIGISWRLDDRWDSFQISALDAHVAVVAFDRLAGDGRRRFLEYARRTPAGIVVLSERRHRLPDLPRAQPLRPGLAHLSHSFPGALHGARADGILFSQALRIEATEDLDPVFRRMLVVPLGQRSPAHTMTALEEFLPRTLDAFRYHWRAHVATGTPKDFLSWVNLERAVVSRPARRPWERHALERGFVLQTVRRTSRRLLNIPLDEAAVHHGEPVLLGFDAFLEEALGVTKPARPGGPPARTDAIPPTMTGSSRV